MLEFMHSEQIEEAVKIASMIFVTSCSFKTSRKYQLKYNVMGDKIIPCIGLSDMGGMQSLWIIRRERRSTHKKITIR